MLCEECRLQAGVGVGAGVRGESPVVGPKPPVILSVSRYAGESEHALIGYYGGHNQHCLPMLFEHCWLTLTRKQWPIAHIKIEEIDFGIVSPTNKIQPS